jgi:hypothetical protein
VGAQIDFSFTACEESSLTLTYSYDGPGLEPASAMESFGCQAEAPFVGLTVYPGTCAGLTVPLPTPVTSVAPGEDYCISTVAGDHVMGDTHTLTSAGVGGETFDLHLCFTNSAGFDPCTDPGAAGSPYVIPLESEDANSFVGGETDFTFTLCEESMLTLTYSYDGPGLAPASISESFDCTDEVLPPGGGFLKYTDEEDEILDPGESFNWYVDVPATSGIWTVKDLLPRGFHLDGPLPAGCWSLFNRYFTCIGFSDNEGVTLVIPVEASDDCGVFTNTAKLIGLNGGFGFDLASDSVSVEGCELQGSSGGGSQQSGSFWDRLWSLIF